MIILQNIVKKTVEGLGYDLIEVEHLAGGILRITIDFPWKINFEDEERFIGLDDCENVTRQLQFLFEVEEIDYKRLEVASPGLDRPLRNENDFERFVGKEIELILKESLGENNLEIAENRKKFKGFLEKSEKNWRIAWLKNKSDEFKKHKNNKKVEEIWQSLDFEFSDLQEAKLVPEINFKGRKNKEKKLENLENES